MADSLKPKIKLFYELNGDEIIRHVHRIFYNKVYSHSWLSRFFEGHDQKFIEDQQTDFMVGKFGGPRRYVGKTPQYAHEHMYITDDLFNVRQKLLEESLQEAGVAPDLAKKWLKIDAAFRGQVIKNDLGSFYEQHTFKTRLVIDEPG